MFDQLYTNIGAKVKVLAVWTFIAEAGIAVLVGLMLLVGDADNAPWAMLIMLLGPAIAWVSSWLLYAFGELVENSGKTVTLLSMAQAAERQPGHAAPPSPVAKPMYPVQVPVQMPPVAQKPPLTLNDCWFCTGCGKRNLVNRDKCWGCGRPMPATVAKTWTCCACGKKNPESVDTCECGYVR